MESDHSHGLSRDEVGRGCSYGWVSIWEISVCVCIYEWMRTVGEKEKSILCKLCKCECESVSVLDILIRLAGVIRPTNPPVGCERTGECGCLIVTCVFVDDWRVCVLKFPFAIWCPSSLFPPSPYLFAFINQISFLARNEWVNRGCWCTPSLASTAKWDLSSFTFIEDIWCDFPWISRLHGAMTPSFSL